MSFFVFVIFSLLFLIFCQTAASFQCYHGESSNLSKMSLMDCVSEICIQYSSPCGKYWATTCYDEMNPLGIYESSFKKVKMTNTEVASSLSMCRQSKCNQNFFQIDDTYLTLRDMAFKTPLPYDNILWMPQNGTRKRTQVLQNTIFLEELKEESNSLHRLDDMNGESFLQFLGQTSKDSKNVWIEFSDDGKSWGKLRLTLDLAQSTVTQKINRIKGSSSTKKVLKGKLTPGQIINVTLTRPMNNDTVYGETLYTLWINGEKIDYFPEKFNVFSHNIRYGGEWRTLNNQTYSKIIPDFSFLKPSELKIQCDDGDRVNPPKSWISNKWEALNPRLGYSRIDLNISKGPYYLFDKGMKSNEILDFEIRDTLCPGASVRRLQFQPYLNGTNVYYNLYTFENQNAYEYTRKNLKRVHEGCLDVAITFKPGYYSSSLYLEVACEKDVNQNNNRTIFVEYRGYTTTQLIYIVRGHKSNFDC